MIVPLGKWKGIPWSDVPSLYLGNLLEHNQDQKSAFIQEASDELVRRMKREEGSFLNEQARFWHYHRVFGMSEAVAKQLYNEIK
jgi:hypothetical protein